MEKERERNIDVQERDPLIGCLLHTPAADLAFNPGMCPDWELNQRSFDSQAGMQSTEPHQLGIEIFSYITIYCDLCLSLNNILCTSFRISI